MDPCDPETETDPAEGGRGRYLRRPEGLVAQTRWLFTLLALASIPLSAPGVLQRELAPTTAVSGVVTPITRRRTGSV